MGVKHKLASAFNSRSANLCIFGRSPISDRIYNFFSICCPFIAFKMPFYHVYIETTSLCLREIKIITKSNINYSTNENERIRNDLNFER